MFWLVEVRVKFVFFGVFVVVSFELGKLVNFKLGNKINWANK